MPQASWPDQPHVRNTNKPLIVTQLQPKRAEIKAKINDLEKRLGQAWADLLLVPATVRLFDPMATNRPAGSEEPPSGRASLGGLSVRAALSMEPPSKRDNVDGPISQADHRWPLFGAFQASENLESLRNRRCTDARTAIVRANQEHGTLGSLSAAD